MNASFYPSLKRNHGEFSNIREPESKKKKVVGELLDDSTRQIIQDRIRDPLTMGRAKWREAFRKVNILCHGYHLGCKIIHLKYWKEVFPVNVASLKLHVYPNKKWEEKWEMKSFNYSYQKFVSVQLNKEIHQVSKINVLYFSAEELMRFQASIFEGKLYKKGKLLSNQNYIFVLNPDNNLFVGNKIVTSCGKIQHSSFTGGGPVRSAGWINFDSKGHVIEIANISGHYRPGIEQIKNMIHFLKRHQVDLSKLSIVFSPEGLAKNLNKFSLEQWMNQFSQREA